MAAEADGLVYQRFTLDGVHEVMAADADVLVYQRFTLDGVR